MILVTGACGYIGSHTCFELIERGYSVLGIDNYANSTRDALFRVEELTKKGIAFHKCDTRDWELLTRIFADYPIKAVIHFAGIRSESSHFSDPIRYFSVNVGGTFTLLQALSDAGVNHLIYSTSVSYYPASKPPYVDVNPFDRSKQIIETVFADLLKANPHWKIGQLNYFNPAGAHPSGYLGENTKDTPSNIMFYAAQVAKGELDKVRLFGKYPTEDSTQIRDYIHVMDLASGHISALEYLLSKNESFCADLGSGQGYSMLEVIHAFEKITGKTIPYEIVDEKEPQLAKSVANVVVAKQLWNWAPKNDLMQMCEDYWRWMTKNPKGYQS